MHTDAFFRMGKTHAVCQDYAVAGESLSGDLSYAIVADGCSSSPRTDFGARFLATAAEVSILKLDRKPSGYEVIANANSARQVLGLPEQCLDATLMVAIMCGYCLDLCVWGDGDIVIIREDGSYEWISLEYASGAPRYLSYTLNATRQADYKRKYGSTRTETVRTGLDDKSFAFTTEKPMCETTYPTHTIKGVLLFSDGLQTFKHKGSNKPVPVKDVLAQVLAFKNLNGAFLQRRLGKFINKFCVKEGWHHDDDFSVAAIMEPR